MSSFQALQNAGKPGGDARLVYFVFDLLYLDGYDLRRLPLIERKERLREVLAEAASPVIQYSDHIEAAGAEFLRESCSLGLEGIISKRRDRPYVAGRSGDWVKIKCLGREELVIGGFTLSTADRRGIGALLVGYFEKGKLVYAGRVGTGFNSQTLLEMRQTVGKVAAGGVSVCRGAAEGAGAGGEVGAAGAGGGNSVWRVDRRRHFAAAVVSGAARGQGGERGAPAGIA